MNGSGGNVAGCATCAGRCCRIYQVAVCAEEIRILVRGTGLPPTDFLRLVDLGQGELYGFRLSRGRAPQQIELSPGPSGLLADITAWRHVPMSSASVC
jgi:hypothetical protein